MPIDYADDASIKMELLCTLPLWPNVAWLDHLSDDFGYSTQVEIRSMLKSLEKKYAIGCGNHRDGPRTGRAAWIHGYGWAKVQRDAKDYWDKMYNSP